jgi:hypothetical protein
VTCAGGGGSACTCRWRSPAIGGMIWFLSSSSRKKASEMSMKVVLSLGGRGVCLDDDAFGFLV